MGVVAWKGPAALFGQAAPSGGGLGQASDPNLARSPSLFDQGTGIMDPRAPYAYKPGAATGGILEGDRGGYGWWGGADQCLVNQVPSTLAAANVAALQHTTAGAALTLVSTTGAGITVGTSITRADTGATVPGLLAIDGAMGFVQNGTTGGNLFWDPTKALARALSLTSSADMSAVNFTARGFDIYGYPVTETIVGPNADTVNFAKALKYVYSITPDATDGTNSVSVGTSDIIGLMLRTDLFQYLTIYWPDTTLIAASTGFTAADTTDPATASTGDVRGTYALQGSASNNTRRLVIFGRIELANCGSAAGLTGITQFADF